MEDLAKEVVKQLEIKQRVCLVEDPPRLPPLNGPNPSPETTSDMRRVYCKNKSQYILQVSIIRLVFTDGDWGVMDVRETDWKTLAVFSSLSSSFGCLFGIKKTKHYSNSCVRSR